MNEWPNEKCIEFVKDYKSFTCLWRTKDPEYTDRNKREFAHRNLAAKYGLASRQAVVNKIKCYRSYFHRLYTYMQRRNSKMGPDDVPYEPNWFLFKHLRFILEEEDSSPEDEVWAPRRSRPGKRNSRLPKRYMSAIQEKKRTSMLQKRKAHGEVNRAERRNYDSDETQNHTDVVDLHENAAILYPVKVEVEEANEDLQNEETHQQASGTHITVPETGDDVSGEVEENQSKMDTANNTHLMYGIDLPENDPVEETMSLLRSCNPNIKKRDHLTVFGEYVEERIRNMKTRRLQAIAQMRISSVLFELEMNQTASADESSASYPVENPEETSLQ